MRHPKHRTSRRESGRSWRSQFDGDLDDEDRDEVDDAAPEPVRREPVAMAPPDPPARPRSVPTMTAGPTASAPERPAGRGWLVAIAVALLVLAIGALLVVTG